MYARFEVFPTEDLESVSDVDSDLSIKRVWNGAIRTRKTRWIRRLRTYGSGKWLDPSPLVVASQDLKSRYGLSEKESHRAQITELIRRKSKYISGAPTDAIKPYVCPFE